jgi:hypothetical protein
MNSSITLSLFAVSLLAIAAACGLLLYIANELRLSRIAKAKEQAFVESVSITTEPETATVAPSKTEEVSDFLSKMQAATLIGASVPQNSVEDQDVT